MQVIEERAETHGDFAETAYLAQALKSVMHRASNWPLLLPQQREALDHNATKVARILSGDPNEPDHWRDIAGYARLGQHAAENWDQ
jgi:hypothetical protein